MTSPATATRQVLKAHFMRGSIPTEASFTDLIDAGLNQADDGIYKLPNEPLSLVRQKPDQPALRFYEDPAAAGYAWQITLADQGVAGFGIANGEGKTSLFIDKATGNLGIGTNAPKQALHVNGTAAITTLHADEVWIAGRKLTAGVPLEGKLRVLENGNVGIGESNPAARLTIRHDVGVDRTAKDPASKLTYGGHMVIKSPSPQLDFLDTNPDQADWAIHVNDGRMYFLRSPWQDYGLILGQDGKVGIGTATPNGKLDVEGVLNCQELIVNNKFRFEGAIGDEWLRLVHRDQWSHAGYGIAADKFWASWGGAYTSSDIRSKDPESIRPIRGAVDQVKTLNPVYYRYNNQPLDSRPKLGFIAQELEEILPEAVGLGPDGMKGIQEGCLIALLAQALKEQQAQIDDLRAELAVIR